jgi:hypothetical protein
MGRDFLQLRSRCFMIAFIGMWKHSLISHAHYCGSFLWKVSLEYKLFESIRNEWEMGGNAPGIT